ncbi:hypothetical protein C8Q80DRAFT_304628 [Daedaleopsis nitida]|nr:hypothetical protein C8Q80DRAFT_304628 [Daedaleopsis nitida]
MCSHVCYRVSAMLSVVMLASLCRRNGLSPSHPIVHSTTRCLLVLLPATSPYVCVAEARLQMTLKVSPPGSNCTWSGVTVALSLEANGTWNITLRGILSVVMGDA